MKTVKLNAFDNPFVYGVNNKEYLVFNIDNETQTLKFQSLIGDLKVKTANILFKANSLPAKLYEMVVDDDILTFTLPSVLTGYNGSMYVYLLLNYSDDLSTSDLYTFKLVDKGSSTFNFEISSICESNISTIVSEEIKNEGIAKSILDTVSNYEFDKLQHAQQSLSLVENAFSSTLEKRIDLFNSAYDKANATKSNTTGDINDSDIDIPSSNTDSDLKDYVENVKTQMSERLKDVTVVSQQIQDEMAQEKQSFLGSSLIFQQDLKQERDIISAYGESTRQHMDQEFNEVKDHADKVFADFSKEIPDLDASIKQVNDKIVATDNKVGTLNTKVTNVENDVTELEKMHNEVTQTINNGKLISLYSNSLDFGDYDYSGNPNLMANINADSFSQGKGALSVVDDGDEVVVTLDPNNKLELYKVKSQPALIAGKTYTMSVEIMLEDDFTGDPSKIGLRYFRMPQWVPALTTPNTLTTAKGVWQKLTVTAKMTTAINNAESWYILLYNLDANNSLSGRLRLRHAKVEEGSTATPYQPNLLDAPYYLSKVALGENLADPKKVFPIKTSTLLVYSGANTEPYIAGQKYTLTMKATKPATQTFNVYLTFGTIGVGLMTPVEGLTDVWQKTFTVSQAHIDAGVTDRLAIYQTSNSSLGAVQIEWVKLEKGDTRTPNIESYKYKGVSLRNTIDPTAFDWQEQIVADVSTLKEQVNTLTPKVDNSQLFKLTKDDGNTIKVDYMSPKPTSFLALAKNTGFYSISTAESKLMSDYNELPALLQNTFLFINNYPPRDGFIIQEITGGEISTKLVHKYYRRIEPDGTYKNWNKVITDKDVSKMKTLYSNCIDFGNYDYSGNPNLMNNISINDISTDWKSEVKPIEGLVKDNGDSFVIDLSKTNNGVTLYLNNLARPIEGKRYTWTIEAKSEENITSGIAIRPVLENSLGTLDAYSPGIIGALTTSFVKYKQTYTTTKAMQESNIQAIQLYFPSSLARTRITIKYSIKWEEGNDSTPYQPNLLQYPYNISAKDVNKNLVDNRVYSNSNYLIGTFPINTPLSNGDKVTFTLKGTKIATKQFGFYVQTATGAGTEFQGYLVPVEGLANTWSWTGNLEIAQTTTSTAKVAVYQLPSTSQVAHGPATIEWAKLEKGETFTPNIERFEYKGISSIETSPNNYYWSAEPFNRSIYSNSVDFGKWDYTGNPNISLPLNSTSFSSGSGGTVSDDGDQIVFTLDGTKLTKYKVGTQTPLVHGKTYTISCEILLESDFVGDPSNIKLQHSFLPGGTIVLQTTTIPSNTLSVWQKLQGTAIINYGSGKPSQWYSVFTNIASNTITGHIRLRNVKIEEARKATPYQPNLLVAPYYLSKVALGENIADPKKVFPVSSTGSEIYSGTMTEPFIVGQTYTVTLEGTKPEHKNFRLFNPGIASYGNFLPVEGLVNVWSLTFTVGQVSSNPNIASINQDPTDNPGSCQINWVKIEKSSVATPNIKEYKYRGFAVKPSNNPNDYEWSIDRQYGEKRLDKMVNTTDPQSIDGTKNFLQVPTVKGNNVLFDEKPLPYEGWYTYGEVLTNLPDKSKLRVGPVVATIGKQYNRSMKDDPLQWNSSRYEATVLRDCTILIEGFARMQYGSGSSGQYGYLVFYRDSAQTKEIGYVGGTGGSVPNTGGTGDKLQWKHGTSFSRIMELHKGEVFNITFSTSSGAKVDFAEVQTLHVMEIDPL